jgi:hypothetical protein
MLNEKSLEMIGQYAAKQNIGVDGLLDLVKQVVAENSSKPGRKSSSNTVLLRQQLSNTTNLLLAYKVKQYTSKELAAVFEQDQTAVNNALRHLEQYGIWKRAGNAMKQPGKRGRAEVVWEIVQ